MKTKNNALATLMFLIILSCAPSKDSSERNKSETIMLVAAESASIDNRCLDLKMERWFEAFNEYQSIGFDMKAADELAVEESNNVYNDCKGNPINLASNQESDINDLN